MTVDSTLVWTLRERLGRIARTPGCVVFPPHGQVTVAREHRLPDDLEEFYRLCGGALLFIDRPYRWRISAPERMGPASPRLLTIDVALEIAATTPYDVTNGCYVIADGGAGGTEPHVVIDLNPLRAGRCYLVGWDTYGVVGEMPVVAAGMADLLAWLLATNGTTLDPRAPLGDAYDMF